MRRPKPDLDHRFALRLCGLLLVAGCLLLASACSGTRKAVLAAQAHPDSLAHAFLRISQRQAWDELVTLCPTPKELKAMFSEMAEATGEPQHQPTFPASKQAYADSVRAKATRLLAEDPALNWRDGHSPRLQPGEPAQVLGQVVTIRPYALVLSFPSHQLTTSLVMWEWKGRHFLADFGRPQLLE